MRPDAKPYTIPPERIRGYATLALEVGQYGVNVAANFCESVVDGVIPHHRLTAEVQARLTRDQLKAELAGAFDRMGAWPCGYDFEQILLVLCDDSVRQPGPDDFGWPEEVLPIRRRVIVEFVWRFPNPCTQCLPCRFWISYHPTSDWSVCKFAFQEPRACTPRPTRAGSGTGVSEGRQPRQRRVRTKTAPRKVVRGSEIVWELGGESDLSAATLPHPPTAREATTVRLTHSNTCGPVEEADFFVRLGELHQPTAAGDLESAADWVPAALVEELVYVDGEEIRRSEALEPFEEETPWSGTYEARLRLPAGRQRLEIKVVSRRPELLQSQVLADWEVNVHE
jgi:hypothetical protein